MDTNSTPDNPAPDLRGTRLLVVDDDPGARLLATTILEASGAGVVAVRDGVEAVVRLRKENFDLVLMDLSMPEMDGIAATKKLQREFSAEPGKLRIAGISINRTTDAKRRALAAGMLGLLPKPVRADTLAAFVASLLQGAATNA